MGREWDAETGLYYNRARYYDPSVGRFLSKDPIGFAGGWNLYAYVNGNPVNYTDPWGLVDFKVNGIKYRFRKIDHHGINPPEPHADSVGGRKTKLGVETGNIYDGSGKKLLGNIGKKALKSIKTALRRAGYLGVAIDVVGLCSEDEDQMFVTDYVFKIIVEDIENMPEDKRENVLKQLILLYPEKFEKVIDE